MVVDASVAVKWLVKEEHTDTAVALLQSWISQDVALAAPYLMPFEVANALHRRVARGELTIGDGARLLAWLLGNRLQLHQSEELHVRALELASELRQGAAYDAHYLALAETLDCELWTADERFYRAASASVPNARWLGDWAVPR